MKKWRYDRLDSILDTPKVLSVDIAKGSPVIINSAFTLCDCRKGGEIDFINRIKKVIFNNPYTIVLWNDDTEKTIVRCQDGDKYNKEHGLSMCLVKKISGNKGSFNDVFAKWCCGEGVDYNCESNGVTRLANNTIDKSNRKAAKAYNYLIKHCKSIGEFNCDNCGFDKSLCMDSFRGCPMYWKKAKICC